MTSIAELSHDEQLALVALLKAIALANRDITEGEIGIIDQSRLNERIGRLDFPETLAMHLRNSMPVRDVFDVNPGTHNIL